jgi:ankyrin repeat protein
MGCGDSYRITRFLLKEKADPKAVDKNGRNALHHAAGRFCNSSPVIRVLLKAGIGIESKDKDGMTALMLACRTNRVDTVVSLLEKGADIDAVDNKGISVSQHAVDGGYLYPQCELSAWRGLQGSDPNVNQTDSMGRTPLMSAPLEKRTVEQLLKAGADLHMCDKQGMTPLMHHAAARYYDAAIVKILVEAGSQLETRDHAGRTALIHCALGWSRIMFFGLVNLGADIHAKDNQGWGVLEHSKDAGRDELHNHIVDYFSRLEKE